jgi:large subunit ribosomal protein L15
MTDKKPTKKAAAKTDKVAKAPAKTASKKTVASAAAATEGIKTLGNLSPAHGSNTVEKRKGRGYGSGLGKTAGRGHKGQRARKSGNAPRGFEGGQMPLYRRLPKRGFTPGRQVVYQVVNLDSLIRVKGDGKITPEVLAKAGLIKDPTLPVKLLARGAIDRKVAVAVTKVSEKAKEFIAKAGGTVEEI